MLKSIVLKNFVHFKDKIVIVLNNSQTEQTEEQSTNAGANTSPIDSSALNNSQRQQTVKQSTNTSAYTTPLVGDALNSSQKEQIEEETTNFAVNTSPLDSNALDNSQKGQPEEESTNSGANTSPLDSNALNNSQREQTEEQSTNTSANTTHLKGNALNSSQREQIEEESTNFGVNTTPLDSNALNNSQIEQTEEQSTNTGANTTHLKGNALNSSQKEQPEEESTNSGANTTHLDSNALNNSLREKTEEQSTNTGANTTPIDRKTVINSQKEQTEEQSPNASKNKTPIHSNGLNIFVGANFCGKSTVCELIRRCMTDEINVSVTRSWDETKVAYAFCQFDTTDHEEIISGIIKDPQMNKFYKVFIYKNRTLALSKLSGSETIQTFSFDEQEGKEVIESIFNKNDDGISDDKVNVILHKINQSEKEASSNEPNWKSLEKEFIATFPLRGIGIVQWTRSIKIGKEKNYKKASKRAEIISELMSQENDDKHFIEKDDTRIFDFLTYPEVFRFKKVDEKIMVQHNGLTFDLLKTSEGILEAKVVSLLLAQDDIRTFCLEEPDRGMHPQMIERLKTVLYKKSRCKTIIVVTHSPYFVDTITIHKTHVFFRSKLHEPYVCSVLNVGDNSDLSKVSDIETLRILLFATKVLLVEGPTDRDIMQAIFTQNKCSELENSKSKESEDYLSENMTAYQIIPMGGCHNLGKVQAFCDYIDLPCLCLLDRDKALGKETDKKTKFWGKRKNIKDIEKLEDKICHTESAKFRTEEICFETYIEALKSKKKSTSEKNESQINEIISFRQKEKKDEDLKNYIEGLETHLSIENISDLRNKPLREYIRVFESKKGDSATELEIENLRKIASFWEKRKKEESFQMYIDYLKEKFKNKAPKTFWENYKNEFEDYLKRLETDRKTFVWRSGELEDALLSSNNCLKIDRVLSLTSHSKTDPPFSSELNYENYKKQAKESLREKLKERLDDCTRKQLAECLMVVDEIKNFLKFVKDETKPE